MQKEGKPEFIQAHHGFVQGIAFSPTDRYKFCSGASDGKIHIYHALHSDPLKSGRMASPNASKYINAVKINADGTRILATTSKRLSVIDSEKCSLVLAYDNCAYSGRDRAPLTAHPHNANIIVSGCTNGKGLITFDLRMQQPAHFSLDVHTSVIRDIEYLDATWPFYSKETLCSVSSDGICKIRSHDDKQLVCFDVKHTAHCVAHSPGIYSATPYDRGMDSSIILIGGDNLSGYIPGNGEGQILNFGAFQRPIYRMRFTSNGYLIYIASGDRVDRYRRVDRNLQFINLVYSHKDDIVDMDISARDEFLVTASRDGTVGLLCLGAPSHGCTGFMQLA